MKKGKPEQFDDATLKEMAKNYVGRGFYDEKVIDVVNKETSYTTTDRNILIRYLSRFQQEFMAQGMRQISMKTMVNTIMEKIGCPDLKSQGYAAQANAAQIRAIYNYIINIPSKKGGKEVKEVRASLEETTTNEEL